jgi:hypothetical protein
VADCGHARTHKTEAKAKAYAAKGNKEYTTKEGNAVCVCHASWTEAPSADIGGWAERPRAFFDCDASLGAASTPEPEPGDYDAAAAREDIRAAVSQSPFDPRDTAAAE